jgi:hypothetical protein
MVGIELPGEDRLPRGQARDLVVALHGLYRGAGRPGLRRIAEAVRSRDDLRDSVSHETISDMLNGKGIPRWSKLDCVVRQLAEWNTPMLDPLRTAKCFQRLWGAAVGDSLDLIPNRAGGDVAITAVTHPMGPEDLALIYEQKLKLALMESGYRVQERSENTGPAFVVEDGQHVIFVDAHHDISMRLLSSSIVDGAIEFAASALPPVLLVANKMPAKRAQSAIRRAENIDFVVWRDERDTEELAARLRPLLARSRA